MEVGDIGRPAPAHMAPETYFFVLVGAIDASIRAVLLPLDCGCSLSALTRVRLLFFYVLAASLILRAGGGCFYQRDKTSSAVAGVFYLRMGVALYPHVLRA
jgi:hypothetical protein